MTSELLGRLVAVQQALYDLLAPMDDAALRRQYHPDLSPAGWHLGHVAVIESYWVQEVVAGRTGAADACKALYFPELSPKPRRGARLPPKSELLAFVRTRHAQNVETLARLGAGAHALLENGYLLHFLIQHHHLHRETLQQIRLQRALAEGGTYEVARPLAPAAPRPPSLAVGAIMAEIGTDDDPRSFDNERRRHAVALSAFRLARFPVTNAEYLGFIDAGGYRRAEYWTTAGWCWREQARCAAPEHWRRDRAGHWYAVHPDGTADLVPDEAVHGLSHHEAAAYARYARARLPTEAEWEHAITTDAAASGSAGQAWEWCANAFHPYPGYRPFPYDGYSLPWFDGAHYALRGASLYTGALLRRPTFRNFYTADKRHVFAGLRLACDAD